MPWPRTRASRFCTWAATFRERISNWPSDRSSTAVDKVLGHKVFTARGGSRRDHHNAGQSATTRVPVSQSCKARRCGWTSARPMLTGTMT